MREQASAPLRLGAFSDSVRPMSTKEDRHSRSHPPEVEHAVAGTSDGGSSLWTKVFFAVVILGLAAGGIGAIKTYLDQSAVGERLVEQGVAAEANVMSATEITGWRSATYTELRVSYDPPGPQILEFAEIQDCTEERYAPGTRTVRVVFLSSDPDVIRLAACRSSFDSDRLPGLIGIALIGVSLFMLWRLRRLWAG